MKIWSPVTALAAFVLTAPATAQTPATPPAPPPKLIVAISVDQLSADLFAEYRQYFTGGLKRLSQGVVFPSGYQSHAASETCPGHSTILTGARPSRTGIIANSWFDLKTAREDKAVYCAEDERVAGSTSSKYTVSTTHLRVPTLGDRMKAVTPASRVVSVSAKDRAAVMMGGKATDEMWWWTGQGFATFAGSATPAVVTRANAAITAQVGRAQPALTLPEVCAARDRAVAIGTGGKTVGTGRFARTAGDFRGFRASPEMDGATLALAAGLITEMQLGKGSAIDLVAIGASATDYVGHTYGTGGSEMCLQLLSLDRDLGDFFAALDAQNIDYVAVLTADHGGHDLPERLRAEAAPTAARVDAALSPDTLGKAIATKLGLTGAPIRGDGPFGDMYIDVALTPRQRAAVLAEATATLTRHPQVAALFSRAAIMASPSPTTPPETWTLLERVRAGFHPEVSGDFVVLLKPRITPIVDPTGGYVATHGSPWDYDRRVPILFWRAGMAAFEQPLSVETVDIMPTLAGLIGLAVPAGEIDGRCLDLDAGVGTTCK